jgi:HAE1 family hydrophobic/amphiphilic exporter-1
LRNLSATLIPSVALPLSLVGTFAVMHLMGYSLDNLSLLALTLSVGFVVDDAIVMLENIVRHMEAGEKPFEAAVRGAREIGFTILSMTLALVAVFIPVLFMGGIVGRLFHEFAVTISVAILISGFVSLSLTPMLSSRFLRRSGEAHHGRIYAVSERAFDGLLAGYEKGLSWSLRHRRITLLYSAVILALTVVLFRAVPKGFLPSEDTGQIIAFTSAPESISFDSMVQHQRAVARVLAADPNVRAFMSSVGGGSRGNNQGIAFMHLKPRSERKLSADEVIQELRPKLARIPGIQTFIQNPPPIRIGGTLSRSQYQFTLQAIDTKVLYDSAQRLEAKMNDLPGLLDVTSDLQIKNPQVEVDIDRDRAASLGISVQQIENALQSAYASSQVSTIFAPSNEYAVIMELLPGYQRDPAALSRLYVRSSSGDLVPLAALATLKEDFGPLSINHLGQLPAVTISFNVEPGVALGTAVGEVERLARTVLPASVSTSFQGTAQAFQSSVKGLGVLLIMAVLVIYLVLGILYESFIHPLTILSALPFAGFGALLTLLVFKTELSIYAFVGIILLVGLVKKNGIMMIDFALEAQRGEGKSPADAIYEACLIRFRPIMMTTMAALMGTLPIAIGFGAGSESRRPLGLAVVGGLLFSQFLTLFVTPVFYLYMDSFQHRLARLFGGKKKRDTGTRGPLRDGGAAPAEG